MVGQSRYRCPWDRSKTLEIDPLAQCVRPKSCCGYRRGSSKPASRAPNEENHTAGCGRGCTASSMTSSRQIECNRRNALQSTGPRTENGKQQSRRNALRHGFTAETVIDPIENPE